MDKTEDRYQMPKRKLRPEIEDITHSGPVSDSMPPVDGWTDPVVEGLTFKNFTWPELRHNDCTMWNASLLLISDGTGRFFSNVRTSDADDAWIINWIALRDTHGVELWRTPKFVGPSMEIDNFHYIFTVDPVFFPAHLFDWTSFLTMNHRC